MVSLSYRAAFIPAKVQPFGLPVIQQQELSGFPYGLYKVIGKDNRSLPFLKNKTISMLYVWDGIQGIGHPELGGYTITLVKRLHIKPHFGIPNWENNGPHVWVIVGDISVDPTYADYMPLIVMRRVHTQELACAREPWGVKGGMTPETYTLPKQQYPAVYGGLG